MARRRSNVLLLLAVLLVAVLLAALWWPRPGAEQRLEATLKSERASGEPTRAPRRTPFRAPRVEVAPTPCLPGATRSCIDGDVWLVDSCGTPEEQIEACSEGCSDGRCESTPVRCTEPVEGRCAGDVVRLCVGGIPQAIDCAQKGMRCGIGSEGAACLPAIPRELQCSDEAARCDGEVLVRCVGGMRERVDCSALNAVCSAAPESARCVATVLAEPSPCGACGCLLASARENDCDGRDEDGDGLLDEGLDCGPVPVVAFVVRGAGSTTPTEASIQAELTAANAAIAAADGEGALVFALARVVPIDEDALRDLDEAELAALSRDERIQGASDEFYVPVLFTQRILASGDIPKPGISTLPNGSCGRVQQGYGPEGGLVAVAELRYPTTLAHELGHYFGLCHTHDAQESEPFLLYREPGREGAVACGEPCRGEGDGVCDTPEDPGPDRCSYDESCSVRCSGAETSEQSPDARNLMSYYALCRERFSREQVALMQHTAALRRGYHRCREGACACVPGSSTCPGGMSCRPSLYGGRTSYRCALDGPRGRAATCTSQRECGHDLLCVAREGQERRCVRACLASNSSCECVDAAAGLRICTDDLKR